MSSQPSCRMFITIEAFTFASTRRFYLLFPDMIPMRRRSSSIFNAGGIRERVQTVLTEAFVFLVNEIRSFGGGFLSWSDLLYGERLNLIEADGCRPPLHLDTVKI